jgi:UDPglucose 6-dehydrogenase
MKISMIGTGYVGLVSGTCFAETGVSVTCVDIDESKIQKLNKGIIPIYEPGLEPMVIKNKEKGQLFFTTSIAESIKEAEVAFIAVGTPPDEDGSADLQYVLAVASEIGKHLTITW